jgi:hypothetical protein
LDCWQFKSDKRPSFDTINKKLIAAQNKYESKRQHQKQMLQMETLFEETTNESSSPFSQFKNDNSASSNFAMNFNFKNNNNDQLNERKLIARNKITGRHNIYNSNSDTTSLLSTGTTILSSPAMRDSHNGHFDYKDTSVTRQSGSEDSQYYSGTDTSLVYADGSNFSSAASAYSNYSMPVSDEAVRAASMMTYSLTKRPPSPPPMKPISDLLNVASAAYHL